MKRGIVWQEFIEVRGARENNLRDISSSIPKLGILVFTGVSGSGKSSLVFDTLAAGAQRQLNEGAMLHPAFAVGGYRWTLYAHSGLLDNDKKLADYTSEEWDTLLFGKPDKIESKTLSGFVKRDA